MDAVQSLPSTSGEWREMLLHSLTSIKLCLCCSDAGQWCQVSQCQVWKYVLSYFRNKTSSYCKHKKGIKKLWEEWQIHCKHLLHKFQHRSFIRFYCSGYHLTKLNYESDNFDLKSLNVFWNKTSSKLIRLLFFLIEIFGLRKFKTQRNPRYSVGNQTIWIDWNANRANSSRISYCNKMCNPYAVPVCWRGSKFEICFKFHFYFL